MNPIRLTLLFLAVALFACDENEEVVTTPETIFTASVESSYPTEDTDDWVMVHTSDGKLLDYKRFEAGETVTIESAHEIPGNTLIVTTLMHWLINNTDYFILKSYLAIPKGDTWTLRPSSPGSSRSGNFLGECKIRINPLTSGFAAVVSDKYSRTANSWWSSSSNTYEATVQIYDNTLKHFVYASDGTDIRYKFVENVKPGDVYELAFAQLNSFDKVLEVEFPQTNDVMLYVVAPQDGTDSGYFTNMDVNSATKSKIKIGYLDQFSKYSTFLRIGYGDRSYSFWKGGAPPATIEFPFNATFTVQDKSIRNFSFTHDTPIVLRTGFWSFRDNAASPHIWIDWSVAASSSAPQSIKELPAEFNALYPALGLDKLLYAGTSFRTSGTSFEEYIDHLFRDGAESAASEVNVFVK